MIGPMTTKAARQALREAQMILAMAKEFISRRRTQQASGAGAPRRQTSHTVTTVVHSVIVVTVTTVTTRYVSHDQTSTKIEVKLRAAVVLRAHVTAQRYEVSSMEILLGGAELHVISDDVSTRRCVPTCTLLS